MHEKIFAIGEYYQNMLQKYLLRMMEWISILIAQKLLFLEIILFEKGVKRNFEC